MTAAPELEVAWARIFENKSLIGDQKNTETSVISPEGPADAQELIGHFADLLETYKTLTSEEEKADFLIIHPMFEVILRASENKVMIVPESVRSLSDIRTGLENVVADKNLRTHFVNGSNMWQEQLSQLPENFRKKGVSGRQSALDLSAINPQLQVTKSNDALYTMSSIYSRDILPVTFGQAYALVTHVNETLDSQDRLSEVEIIVAAERLAQNWLNRMYQVDESLEDSNRTRTIYNQPEDGSTPQVLAVLPEIVGAESRQFQKSPDVDGDNPLNQEVGQVCVEWIQAGNEPVNLGAELDTRNAKISLLTATDETLLQKLLSNQVPLAEALQQATVIVPMHLSDASISNEGHPMNIGEGYAVSPVIQLVKNSAAIVFVNGCAEVVEVTDQPTATPAPGSATPAPTATPGHTEVPPTGTPDQRPSLTPGPTRTPGPTQTATATATASATNTAQPTFTATATATAPASNTPEPTPTWEPTATKLPPVEPTATQVLDQPTAEPSKTADPRTPVPTALPF
jgi:hypothetical protein